MKNCFRKASISPETQIASIEDEYDPFKILAENVSDLKSCGLIDENIEVDDCVDIDFEIRISETHTIADQEILDFVLSNDCAEEEEEKDEEPKRSEIASEIALLERWSFLKTVEVK